MNFLAHAFLSGNDEMILTGNFIGDSVKGNRIHLLPFPMQRGVLLHRAIDAFTDEHPVTQLVKQKLNPWFRKYSGVATDVYFDHFLACSWNRYSEEEFSTFVTRIYTVVEKHHHLLPEKSAAYLPYMIKNDWLGSYSTVKGISDVLIRMGKRTSFYSGFEQAEEALNVNYGLLTESFSRFFPDLIGYSQNWLKTK